MSLRSRIQRLERDSEPDKGGRFLGLRRFWIWFASEPGSFLLTPAEEAELDAAIQDGPPADAVEWELERLKSEIRPPIGLKELPRAFSPN
jgi:hypothetical protein